MSETRTPGVTMIRRSVDRYLARGTDGLSAADASLMRRLNSWFLLINVLMPPIIVQQFLGPQRRTALVNVGFWLVTGASRMWTLCGSADRMTRAVRSHNVILVAGIVDLVVTALLNGGVEAAGLWYLVLVPMTVAHMRGARQTILWTGICVAAVCVVAIVDPFWPFARDLRTETLGVVVSMRIMLLGAVGAFALASAKAANHHIAAIEEREARLQQTVAALRDAEQELTTKNAELDSFVYSVSHDLKAPLVAVQGFAGILADDYGPQLDAEGRHFLGRVQANVQQMERLIRDLLALSRLGRDGRSLELVELGEVVDEFVAEASETLHARGVTVRRRDLGVLWGVRTEVEQLMRNLLSNAVKYLGDTEAPLIEVGMREAGPMVECWVKDNGIGIDPRYHDKVFEIFQRLQDVEAEGTGVGLAIVRKVVSRGGGRVWVESRKGQGATFRFTWPAHAAAPGAEAVPAAAAS